MFNTETPRKGRFSPCQFRSTRTVEHVKNIIGVPLMSFTEYKDGGRRNWMSYVLNTDEMFLR